MVSCGPAVDAPPNPHWIVPMSTGHMLGDSSAVVPDRRERSAGGGAGMDVLPTSIEWNMSSKELVLFAWREGAGLQSGDFRIVDPSTSVAIVMPHDGISLASQRRAAALNGRSRQRGSETRLPCSRTRRRVRQAPWHMKR